MTNVVSCETAINTTRRCPCGKEDCRPGQRNGLICAAKANREHRARLRATKAAETSAALASIAARARDRISGESTA